MKREDKIYSLKEAMKLLQTSKYQNYTTIPVEEGYRLVPMHKQEEEISISESKRDVFLNRLKKRAETQDFTKVPDHYNYQAAKEYRQSQGISR